MSEEELIDMLYSKFCNENDDYDMRYTDIIYNSIEEKDKQLDKYKNVIDKIKEKLKEKDENGFEKIYVEDAIIFIDELLEEVE